METNYCFYEGKKKNDNSETSPTFFDECIANLRILMHRLSIVNDIFESDRIAISNTLIEDLRSPTSFNLNLQEIQVKQLLYRISQLFSPENIRFETNIPNTLKIYFFRTSDIYWNYNYQRNLCVVLHFSETCCWADLITSGFDIKSVPPLLEPSNKTYFEITNQLKFAISKF